MQAEPSWSLYAKIHDNSYLITVYGIKSEAEARETAAKIAPVCDGIMMKCIWKETKYSRWKTEETCLNGPIGLFKELFDHPDFRS